MADFFGVSMTFANFDVSIRHDDEKLVFRPIFGRGTSIFIPTYSRRLSGKKTSNCSLNFHVLGSGNMSGNHRCGVEVIVHVRPVKLFPHRGIPSTFGPKTS